MAMNLPDRFERRARALHLEASRRLDPEVIGRLRTARRDALQSVAAPAMPAPLRRALLPVGAFAVLALAMLLIWPTAPRHTPSTSHIAAVSNETTDSDLPPDLDSADPALYRDLDFYGWLASDQHGGTAP
jgi:hypothetical protein